MRVLWVLLLMVLILIMKNYFDLVRDSLETFVDDYTIIAKDAFPCPADAVAQYPGMQGCYYHDLAGCAMFPVTAGIAECPSTVVDLKSQLNSPKAAVQAANTSIFDYIYDKVKQTGTTTASCPNAQCSFDFFRKMQVMTDSELSDYLDRIKDDACAAGAVCLQPDNLAQYISDTQVTATAQGLTCKDAQKAFDTAVNQSSKKLVQRVYPDCTLAPAATAAEN